MRLARRPEKRLLLLLPVLSALLLLAHRAPAAERPGEVYEPPVYTGDEISLLTAVRLTLEHVPAVRLQREDALLKQGVLQEASGQFDAKLVGDLSFEYTQEELTKDTKKSEQKKRDELSEDVVDLAVIEDAAYQRSSEFAVAGTTLDQSGDLHAVTFTDDFDQAEWDLLVAMYETADPEAQDEVKAVIRQWVAAEEDASQTEGDEAREERQDAEDRLRKMGAAPQAEETYKGSVKLELQKAYRTGVTIAPFFQLSGGGNNFLGKPHSSDYGGKGVTDNYKALVGFRVNVPLGRGRGMVSTAAAENAARYNYDASVATITHTASASVHQTVLAYWELAGAQEKLTVLGQSLDLHRRLLDISERMVRSDRIPRAELARARAREAEARAMVEEARRGLQQSRFKLAKTIGLEVTDPSQAPLASDSLPAFPDTSRVFRLDESALATHALRSRYDYRAAGLIQEAGKILLQGAESDVQRKADLEIEVSASGRDEEHNVLDGLGGALADWTGPSAKVGLSVEWPFGNNVQQGQLEQKLATYRQNRITARDLKRTIQSNVIQTVGLLREEARKLQQYTEAVGYYRESVDAEAEKFRVGRATLINTITTEQRQLDAELALVRSRQRHAELLTTLRYETGTLVSERPGGGIISEANLLRVPESNPWGTE